MSKIKNHIGNFREKLSSSTESIMKFTKTLFFSFIVLVVMIVITDAYRLVLDIRALETLVEAEATIFGFFGIFFIYAIKRFDDELKEIKVKIETNQKLYGKEFRLKIRKQELVWSAIGLGITITASMMLSVWLIGSLEVSSTSDAFIRLRDFLGSLNITCFLFAVGIFIISMFEMGKEI